MSVLTELLTELGLRVGPPREYLRGWCPFHPNPSGKTLWISHATGVWGCLSTRCPQHNGGHGSKLERLLVLRGVRQDVAASTVRTLDLRLPVSVERPTTLKDRDYSGVVTEAHLAVWEVDWDLAQETCEAVAATGGVGYNPEVPVSSWVSDVPSEPGDVEHDCWEWLWYWLMVRRLSPSALTMMDVGFDREHGVAVFPIRGPDGVLRGIARRACVDGADYHIENSVWVEGEPGYQFNRVRRGDVLWGWSEQSEQIAAGRPVITVEGYVDQLRLIGLGYCAVAKLSHNITDEQLELLTQAPGRKVDWPDFDREGLRAARSNAARMVARSDVAMVSDSFGHKDPGVADVTADVARAAISTAVHPALWLAGYTKVLARAVG